MAEKFNQTNPNTYEIKKESETDSIVVEVGDSKQPEFIPQVKISRLNNQANFSIRYISESPNQEDYSHDDKNILWDNGLERAKFYPVDKQKIDFGDYTEPIERYLDGAFEFEIELDQRPINNQVNFSLNTKNTVFYYQPPLTEEEIIAKEIDRPADIEGSYAVYYQSKFGENKIGHIYRPRIFDASGDWIWGEMLIDGDLLTISISSDFLDKAVYPIIVDPTIGYTTQGASNTAMSSHNIYGSIFTYNSGYNCTATSIFGYVSNGLGGLFKFCIYDHSDLSLVGYTKTRINSAAGWYGMPFISEVTLVDTKTYLVALWEGTGTGKSNDLFYFDAGTTDQGHAAAATFNGTGGPPDPLTISSHNTNKYSIYVNYDDGNFNKVIAQIYNPTFKNNLVRVNLISPNTSSQTKANILAPVKRTNSVKGNFKVTQTKNILVKANIVSTINQINYIIASIFTSGGEYVVDNLVLSNLQGTQEKANTSTASILVENQHPSIVTANIQTVNNKENYSKANLSSAYSLPLVDNFNDNSLASVWHKGEHATDTSVEEDGVLKIQNSTSSTSGYIRSTSKYVAKYSTLAVKVTQHCTDGGFKLCPTDPVGHQWDVYSEAAWYNFQLIASTVVSPSSKTGQVGGDSPSLTVPYWLRMRVDDAKIYFDYKDNESDPWTNISSESWSLSTAITDEYFVYLTGYNVQSTGVPNYDDFSWIRGAETENTNAGLANISRPESKNNTATANILASSNILNYAKADLLKTVKVGSYPNGYSHRKTITIDHNQVSGSSNHANFPLLFSGTYAYLATIVNGGSVTNSNGYDIVFSSDASGNNILDHEIELYEPSTGKVVMWIRIPDLDCDDNTTLYVWYGNANVSVSQEDKDGVWNSNFVGVYHLNTDLSSTSMTDSSGTGNTGTPSGFASDDLIDDKIGKGQDLDGSEYANLGHASSLDLTSNFTVSYWFASDQANIRVVLGKVNSWYISYHINKLYYREYNGATWTTEFMGTDTLTTGVQYRFSIIKNGTSLTAIVNNTSNSGSGETSVNSVPSTDMQFGRFDTGFYLDGNIDELKISNTNRSLDWELTEYNNQNSPSTFYSVGGVDDFIYVGANISITGVKNNTSKANISQTSTQANLVKANLQITNTSDNLVVSNINSSQSKNNPAIANISKEGSQPNSVTVNLYGLTRDDNYVKASIKEIKDIWFESFEPYTNGALVGQGDWYGDTPFTIQSSLAYHGSKSAAITLSGESGFLRAHKQFKKLSAGTVVFYMRGTATNSRGLVLFGDGTTMKIIIYFMSTAGKLSYYSGGAVDFANVSSGVWYKIEVEWRSTPSKQFRIRMDDGTWSSFVDPYETWTDGLDTVILDAARNVGSGTAYFDYFKFPDILTNQTITANLTATVNRNNQAIANLTTTVAKTNSTKANISFYGQPENLVIANLITTYPKNNQSLASIIISGFNPNSVKVNIFTDNIGKNNYAKANTTGYRVLGNINTSISSNTASVMDKDGNTYVVFGKYGEGITVYKSTDGVNFLPLAGCPISSDGAIRYYNPSLAVDGNNHIHVCWDQTHPLSGGDYRPYYAYFDGESWTIERIKDFDYLDTSEINISIDKNNKPHVVLEGGISETDRYPKVRYTNKISGTWSDLEEVAPSFPSGTLSSTSEVSPNIVVDKDLTTHVTFVSYYGGEGSYDRQLYYTYKPFGGSWQTPLNLHPGYPDINHDVYYMDMALDPCSSEVYISWIGPTESSWNSQSLMLAHGNGSTMSTFTEVLSDPDIWYNYSGITVHGAFVYISVNIWRESTDDTYTQIISYNNSVFTVIKEFDPEFGGTYGDDDAYILPTNVPHQVKKIPFLFNPSQSLFVNYFDSYPNYCNTPTANILTVDVIKNNSVKAELYYQVLYHDNFTTANIQTTITKDNLSKAYVLIGGSWPVYITANIEVVNNIPNQTTASIFGSSFVSNQTKAFIRSSIGFSSVNQILIDESKVSGTTDLIDFPIIFSSTFSFLKATINGGSVSNSNGYDIVFTDSSGNLLNHEIDSYDSGTGQLTAHIRIPTLYATTTTIIYIYTGNSNVTSTLEYPAGVWDDYYRGVWHLKENPAGSAPQMLDSTAHAGHMTSSGSMVAGDSVTGRIGQGLEFDGTNQYLTKVDSGVADLLRLNQSQSATMSGWVYAKSLPNSENFVWGKYDYSPSEGYVMTVKSTGAVGIKINGYLHDFSSAAGAVTTNNWYYLVGVYSGGGTVKVYKGFGGSVTEIVNQSYTPSYIVGANEPWTIANASDALSTSYDFTGVIDEVRVSITNRSLDWITTEYNNQYSPETFYFLANSNYVTASISGSNWKENKVKAYLGVIPANKVKANIQTTPTKNNFVKVNLEKGKVNLVKASIDPGNNGLLSKVGSFAQPTTPQTQSVTGLGFKPKAIIFFGNHQTADGSASHARIYFGAATSPDNEAVIASGARDGASPENTSRRQDNTKSVLIITEGNTAPTVSAAAELYSMDDDGFTLNWTTANSTQRIVNYMALGGPAVRGATIKEFLSPVVTGNNSVSGVGFKPDYLLVFSSNQTTTPPSSSADFSTAIGMVSGTSNQATLSTYSGDSGGHVGMAQRTNLSIISTNNSTTLLSASLASFDTDGFTLNWSTVQTDQRYLWALCIRGPRVIVGSNNKPTVNYQVQTITGAPARPVAMLLASYNYQASSGLVSYNRQSIGATSGVYSNRAAIYEGDDSYPAVWADSVLNRNKAIVTYYASSLPIPTGFASVSRITDDGVDLTWDSCDSNAFQYVYTMFGNAIPEKMFENQTVAWITTGYTSNNTAVANILVEKSIINTTTAYISWPRSSEVQTIANISTTNQNTSLTISRIKSVSWMSGWLRRKKITLSGSLGAGTNYQVLLKIGESSGSVGADFHLNNNSSIFPSSKDDGGDLRFTAENGTTLIDYWVEDVVGNTPNRIAWVWVEVSSDLDRDQEIYVYYENPEATNLSSGGNTFLLFDDFNEAEIDSNRWVKEAEYGSISFTPYSGYIRCGGGLADETPYGWVSLGSSVSYSSFNNNSVRFKARNSTDGIGEVAVRGDFSFNYGYKARFDSRIGYGNSLYTPPYNPGSWQPYSILDEDVPTADVWYTYEFSLSGTTHLFYRDNTLKISDADSGYLQGGEISLQNHYGDHTDYDWVFVRKFIATEPDFSSVDTEEYISTTKINLAVANISVFHAITQESITNILALVSHDNQAGGDITTIVGFENVIIANFLFRDNLVSNQVGANISVGGGSNNLVTASLYLIQSNNSLVTANIIAPQTYNNQATANTGVDLPLIDNFNDNSLSGLWHKGEHPTDTSEEADGELKLKNSTELTSGYIRSAFPYAPRYTTLTVRLTSPSEDGGFKLCPTDPAGHIYDVYSEANWYNLQPLENINAYLSPNKRVSGVGPTQIGGDSPLLSTPLWMRMRIDDSRIYFDYRQTEADNWTNISSEDWSLGTSITDFYYVYFTGYNVQTTGTPSFDDFSWMRGVETVKQNQVSANISVLETRENSVQASISITGSHSNSTKANISSTKTVTNQAKANISNQPTTTLTYWFDGSDALPYDANNVWDNEDNLIDSSELTYTYTSTTSNDGTTNSLFTEGTNALTTQSNPLRGFVQHSLYMYNDIAGKVSTSVVYSDNKAQTLYTWAGGSVAPGWTQVASLSVPTGGWTWDKIASLENKLALGTGSGAVTAYFGMVRIYATAEGVLEHATVNILATNSRHNSVKASIQSVGGVPNNVKANILATTQLENTVTANTSLFSQKNNQTTADITRLEARENAVKADISITQLWNNVSKASLSRVETNNCNTTANITVLHTQPNAVKASISRFGQNPQYVVANLQTTNLNNNTAIANLVTLNNLNNFVKASLYIQQSKTNFSKANLSLTNTNTNNSTASIFVSGACPNSVKANLSITNNKTNFTKANLSVSRQFTNTAKANLYLLVEIRAKANSAIANILRNYEIVYEQNLTIANIIVRGQIYKGIPQETKTNPIYTPQRFVTKRLRSRW